MDEQTVGQYWDGNAAAWIEGVRSGYDIYREHINNPAFLEMLPDIKGWRVLDVGCGEGCHTRQLAERGASLTGIDIAEKLIKAARDQEKLQPQGIEYHLCSGANLACFEDASFEGVVSTMALMDMPDYQGCIREIARVLKPGGLFQFSILHPLIHIRQFKWISDEKNKRTGAEVGDYFGLNSGSDETEIEEWKFSHSPPEYRDRVEPFQVPYFRRTLSEYVNCLAQNHLQILQLREPYADIQAVEKYPQMYDSRTLPYFLIFQCRKAAV